MFRKTSSLTLAFSGLVMLLTSVVLYFGPAGQVGHFCPWTFLGLSRHHWGVLHLNSGLLFCLAMVAHTCLNWRPLVAYVTMRRSKYSAVPLTVSLLLTLYVCVGGYYEIPPMGQFLDVARACRMASMKKYGAPPYGTAADYPATQIARYMGWNPETSLEHLTRYHIVIQSPDQSLADLARKNNTSIGRLLDIMCTQPAGERNDCGLTNDR